LNSNYVMDFHFQMRFCCVQDTKVKITVIISFLRTEFKAVFGFKR